MFFCTLPSSWYLNERAEFVSFFALRSKKDLEVVVVVEERRRRRVGGRIKRRDTRG